MPPRSGHGAGFVSRLILFILFILSKFFSSRRGKGRVGISDRIYRIDWIGPAGRVEGAQVQALVLLLLPSCSSCSSCPSSSLPGPAKAGLGFQTGFTGFTGWGLPASSKVPRSVRKSQSSPILFILFILSKTPVPTPLRRPLAVRNGGNLRWGS